LVKGKGFPLAASSFFLGLAAASGLIRDASGRWLTGFMAHRGVCSNTVAELQAIRHGLELAWIQGYRKVSIPFMKAFPEKETSSSTKRKERIRTQTSG
ncbi:hypothetical protein CCACVL1_21697, partial [Corchorus capsularis]